MSSKIKVVKKIILDVKKNKDQSLLKYEKKFSKLKKLNKNDLVFSKSEINKIIKRLDKKTKNQLILLLKEFIIFIKIRSLKILKF